MLQSPSLGSINTKCSINQGILSFHLADEGDRGDGCPQFESLTILVSQKPLEMFLFKVAIHGLCFFFFLFVFSTVNSKYIHCKILPMTGLERKTSGLGSDHSAN